MSESKEDIKIRIPEDLQRRVKKHAEIYDISEIAYLEMIVPAFPPKIRMTIGIFM